MRWCGCWLAVVLLVSGSQAAEPQGKVLREVWEAAFLEGAQVGHVHSLYREVMVGERKAIEATMEMDLTLTRFGEALKLSLTIGGHEAEDGCVLTVLMKQDLGKKQALLMTGKADGDQLLVKVEVGNNPPVERKVPLDKNKKIIGLYAVERLFEGKKLEPNTKLTFHRYEPVFTSVVTNHVEIKDYEEVALLKGKKQRLLRVETKLDKIMGVDFPPEIAWLDADGTPVKRQMQIPGFGLITIYRTTKELATARGGKAPVDIGFSQQITLTQPVKRPYDTREIVYRVQLKDIDDPKSAFPGDYRQEVRNIKGNQVEVVVRGFQQPGQSESRAAGAEEYLKSNQFIRSDDARVKELAAKAVGKEKDPWKQAQAVERWVKTNLKNKNATELFATADHVARTLEGDCTEHALLGAAMCRAAGVPSRTVFGLVLVPPNASKMGYHAWIEVWVNGQWYPLDPMLGKGGVPASHIKITDHHWNDIESLTPLLPVIRMIGKVQVEVVSVKHEP